MKMSDVIRINFGKSSEIKTAMQAIAMLAKNAKGTFNSFYEPNMNIYVRNESVYLTWTDKRNLFVCEFRNPDVVVKSTVQCETCISIQRLQPILDMLKKTKIGAIEFTFNPEENTFEVFLHSCTAPLKITDVISDPKNPDKKVPSFELTMNCINGIGVKTPPEDCNALDVPAFSKMFSVLNTIPHVSNVNFEFCAPAHLRLKPTYSELMPSMNITALLGLSTQNKPKVTADEEED
jgi:hypothetical protein